MDNKKKPVKPNEKDSGKELLGKRHDESKPDDGKAKHKSPGNNNISHTKNWGDKMNEPEKKIEIDDNPEETKRKIPNMKH
jgi:hypothetical protein